eukprot:TRINITY_DN819_c0_g3_i1.p1 TRINITY_DN819_c0_g3~~TRINITY_DN819_c0_g3_i1.p1  ORF type:complete len:410 (-),score=49.72 TRINITY_DN819_c0_g3_i1:40-1269(-)
MFKISLLLDLPDDILIEVLCHLSLGSLASVSLVCQDFFALSETGSIWKTLCNTQFGLTFRDGREQCWSTCSTWKEIFKRLLTQGDVASLSSKKNTSSGCSHYQRFCQIRARCCDRFFPCRLCHDSVQDHQINRFETDTMICMKCLCVQGVGKYCSSCKAEMSNYYCSRCKLWAVLSEDSRIYHCEKCGICRQGKGLGVDNWHCDTCGICLSLSVKETHVCQIRDGLKVTCPLCEHPQLLFYSRVPVIVMSCGHAAHWKCFMSINPIYRLDNFPCPLCVPKARQPLPPPPMLVPSPSPPAPSSPSLYQHVNRHYYPDYNHSYQDYFRPPGLFRHDGQQHGFPLRLFTQVVTTVPTPISSPIFPTMTTTTTTITTVVPTTPTLTRTVGTVPFFTPFRHYHDTRSPDLARYH